jgi:hypothetical protein
VSDEAQAGPATGRTVVPARGLGRLRRQPGGRTHNVRLVLSDRELTVLTARAERAGVSVQRFLLESALIGNQQTVTERHALYRTLLAARRTVAGVANNLNQLARVANTTGRLPGELGNAMESVVQASGALEASLVELSGRPAP